MAAKDKTVLLTGCSEGSLGAVLALEFHKQGLKVFATARSLDKTFNLQREGIQCLELDVQSDTSIKSCVEEVSKLTSGKLDILVNNAGAGHYMPFMHLDLAKAKQLFDLNVWSYLAVTQAFLPLLLKNASPKADGAKSMIVNNTSISSVLRTPFHSAYGASKAAMAAFNDAQRIELRPFGIQVIDLKTGSLESKFGPNRTNALELPADSPYKPIEKEVLNVITGAATEAYAEDQTTWARNVVRDLLRSEPPAQIWRGGKAGTIQAVDALPIPIKTEDSNFMALGGLDKLETLLSKGV